MALAFFLIALPLAWSQETCLDSECVPDDSAIIQMNVNRDEPLSEYRFSQLGESCGQVCGGDNLCDLEAMEALTGRELDTLLTAVDPRGIDDEPRFCNIQSTQFNFQPYVQYIGSPSYICVIATQRPPTCASSNANVYRVCACIGGFPTTSGGAEGDPHIDTLEGEHYLLLKQGTFSFWQLSGLDAEIQASHTQKKVPIDFKVYAHYSGHASYTKALLLLDQAANSALEITAKDCQWRWKTANGWSVVDTSPKLLSVPDADGDHMTGLEVDGKNHVKFLMKQADGSWKHLGNLLERCKPGHFMNIKFSMPEGEIHLAGGQLGGRRDAGEKDWQLEPVLMQGATQQEVGRTDQEFQTSKSWLDLGGSAEADLYLKSVDEQGGGGVSFFSKACSESELEDAKKECTKHFGEAPKDHEALRHFTTAVESCAYDVCHGGDELVAELAAEIWHAK